MGDVSEDRADVVAEARAWLGTSYHHAADIKGVGVDCAMLLLRVFCDLGLVEPFDPRPYSPDWMMHRSEEKFLNILLAHAHEVAAPEPGDVMIFRMGRCFSHGGIVTVVDPLTIIHAFLPVGIVLEEDITKNAQLAVRRREAIFASYWP